MPLQCANCGQKNLPDQARFCHNCGAPVTVDEDEATRFVPADDPPTVSLDPAEATMEDEATRHVDNTKTADDDEATRAVFELDTGGDDVSTRALTETAAVTEPAQATPSASFDDEATRYVSETVTADETTQQPAPSDSVTRDRDKAEQSAPEPTGTSPSPSQDALKSGEILEQRYQLEKTLGKGGFGAVYLAEDIKLKRRCVVKQMLVQGKSPKEVALHQANFRREANLLAELNDPGHPNIPEIYDYFSTESGNYLVMKYIEGRNLKDALTRTQDIIPWREAVQYAIEVCSALDYMHNKGDEPILHRDIKPANILLGDDGRVWLVDFGLAKAEPVESSSQDQGVTQASGSLGYTPLEQWFGQAVPASDIYALGATLHHLVTGVSPLEAFNGKFNLKLISDLHGQFTPIRKIDRKLPKRLEQIISQAVSAGPEERPLPHQFQQQLEALITAGQATALYTFKNGKSAKTVPELVDLCEANRQEAQEYLYSGDFERWFLLINRNDLAEAAAQAVKPGKGRANGLDKFLKLIMPNLFWRRTGKVARRTGLALAQIMLIALALLLFLLIGGSYGLRWFAQQNIGNKDWDYYSLDLEQENIYTEEYLTEQLQSLGLFNQVRVNTYPPNGFDIIGRWDDLPFDRAVTVPLSATVQLENHHPRFQLTAINGIPLFVIGQNISAGINEGLKTALQDAPVEISSLHVAEDNLAFNVDAGAGYAPPVVAATPTPIPSPTPTGRTMVVVFNQAPHTIILEIEGEDNWKVEANSTRVIELPAGKYFYKVRSESSDILAVGDKTWNAHNAYRLDIIPADALY